MAHGTVILLFFGLLPQQTLELLVFFGFLEGTIVVHQTGCNRRLECPRNQHKVFLVLHNQLVEPGTVVARPTPGVSVHSRAMQLFLHLQSSPLQAVVVFVQQTHAHNL